MLCKAYIVRESNEKAECLMFTNHPMLGASTAVNTERRWRIKPHLRFCHLVKYSDRLQLSNFKMSSSNVSENKCPVARPVSDVGNISGHSWHSFTWCNKY